MVNYKKLYIQLFKDVEDAIQQLEVHDPDLALMLLINAQRDAEKSYIEQDADEEAHVREYLFDAIFELIQYLKRQNAESGGWMTDHVQYARDVLSGRTIEDISLDELKRLAEEEEMEHRGDMEFLLLRALAENCGLIELDDM